MADLSQYDSAFDALKAMLDQYNLGSLSNAVLGFLQDGYSQDQVSVFIQDTPEYKQRFAGNDKRRAAGIPVLSPKDYLSVEDSYRQIMASSGMPKGFYDEPDDFASWIGLDVAPTEISSRVSMAVDAANRVDQETRNTFQQWYGVGPNDLAAFFLDQSRAMPHIAKIANAAKIGGDAARDGLNTSQARAESLGGLVGDRNVDQLMQQVSAAGGRGEELSNIYGGADYRQADAENEVFSYSDEARRKRESLAAQEKAAFSGKSGLNQGSLSKAKNY